MSEKSKIASTYMKYRSKLMRAISSIVDANDIEDIVQDAFVKSYEAELKQESFRGEWERQKLLEILVLRWEREKPDLIFL